MGWIERLAIRAIEPVLEGRWLKGRSRVTAEKSLKLGDATAAFGRRRSEAVVLSARERLSHSSSFGASGAGKTVQQLGTEIHDIKTRQPFLKLELHDAVNKLLRVVAAKVVSGEIEEDVIDDIWVVSPGHSDSWYTTVNPIYCPSPAYAPVTISAIMQLLNLMWKNSLGPQTHEFAQNLLILMAESRQPLSAVNSIASDPVALRSHAINLVNHGAREYFLRRFLVWSPRRRNQVMEAFLNKITIFLSDPRIAAMLSASTPDIDFRKIIDQKKTVLIEISKAQFFDSAGTLSALILVGLLQAVFSREDVPESKRHPYLIVIDEFPSFSAALPAATFLNETRKYGCGLTLISQTCASLDREMLSSIRANCYTQLYFRLSPEDARIAAAGLQGESRDLLARELVQLPTGTAMLMLGGGQPRRLKIENTPVPARLSTREREIIDRIRRNVGRPLNLSRGASGPTEAIAKARRSPAPATESPASTTRKRVTSHPPILDKPGTAATGEVGGGFVEGDD